MIIKKLCVRNYRNYKNLTVDFKKKLIVIIGNNGVGKTNLLESIALLSTTRSFRTKNNSDLIKEDCEYAVIDGIIDDFKLKISISNLGKNFYKDENFIKKYSDFFGIFQSLVFYPGDLNFLNNPPKERRKFIDNEISKIDKLYLNNLIIYNKLLKDRNKILKEKKVNYELIDVIDNKLIDVMEKVCLKRIGFINSINKKVNEIFGKLSKEKGNIRVIYKSDILNLNCNQIVKLFKMNLDKDVITKQTNIGIHRDDLNIKYNDLDVKGYCSQGQTRLIMLAIKLSLKEIMEKEIGVIPVLLFDDVMSELDLDNQKMLFEYLGNQSQTIITTTHLDGILRKVDKQIIELGENYESRKKTKIYG